MKKTIGWIGTGVMGYAMCERLMNAGYHAKIHTRTKKSAEPLLEAGADWYASPQGVAEGADIVFTMLGYPEDVENVYFAREGLLAGLRESNIFVDMTTTRPKLAKLLCGAVERRGAFYVDAPVSGGDVGAREGTLSIMVGGKDSAIRQVMPLFEIMGESITHLGPGGAGQHTKMCNQIVIAGTMIGVCESLIYAKRAGLDVEQMLSSIRVGAAGCWTLDHLAPRILARDFKPGFYVDHFIKDMELALEEAARMDLSLPGLALVNQLYRAVKAQKHGKSGTQALILGLEQMSGLDDREWEQEVP